MTFQRANLQCGSAGSHSSGEKMAKLTYMYDAWNKMNDAWDRLDDAGKKMSDAWSEFWEEVWVGVGLLAALGFWALVIAALLKFVFG
jgi:hypothetical protein